MHKKFALIEICRYICVIVIDATIFTVVDLLHLQGGYPFRGSIEESVDGDVLALQMKDVDLAWCQLVGCDAHNLDRTQKAGLAQSG